MEDWIEAWAAGALFGAAAGALLLLNGKIAGISGIAGQALETSGEERAWRLWLLGGLLAGGAVIGMVLPTAVVKSHFLGTPWLVIAGVLIGFGARIGNGCTSGHGVCGVGRWSRRSLVAVATFSATGALAYRVIAALGGLS